MSDQKKLSSFAVDKFRRALGVTLVKLCAGSKIILITDDELEAALLAVFND
jgi:hypothetical protein